MKKVTLPGIVFDDTKKKFKAGKLEYDLPDEKEVNSYGKHVSEDVAQTLLKSFHDKFKSQPQAVTFGKDALLSILAQKNCEGIRFYFGNRTKDQWEGTEEYTKWEGITLIAIGVNDKDHDIGTGKETLFSKTNMKAAAKGAPIIIEVVPPTPK